MELHVNVDEADIGKTGRAEGELHRGRLPKPHLAARITQARYGSSTTSGVVTYETILKVDNPTSRCGPE